MSRVNWATPDELIEAQLKWGDDIRAGRHQPPNKEARCGNPEHRTGPNMRPPFWHTEEYEFMGPDGKKRTCVGSWQFPMLSE